MTMETGQHAAPAAERADQRVLFCLKTKGAMAARHLAGRLGVSVVAVRRQLSRLEEAGLVRFEEERRGPGRPERIWRLTADGHQRFPDSHAELTLELVASIRRVFGEEGLDRLIGQREKAMQASYDDAMRADRSLEARIGILARMRTREGYMAEYRKLEDGAFLLIENHCPICAAAQTCRGFCRSELNVFRTVLGPKARVTRTDHMLSGAPRCAYRIESAACS